MIERILLWHFLLYQIFSQPKTISYYYAILQINSQVREYLNSFIKYNTTNKRIYCPFLLSSLLFLRFNSSENSVENPFDIFIGTIFAVSKLSTINTFYYGIA
ncbi:MAG: hypothetical protein K0S61_1376 [Anaerocolumna sp.]|nr:hypothetical protein [Anaerocolumna sp.]